MAIYYLDPNGTAFADLSIAGIPAPPTHHEAVDEGARQPSVPGGFDSVYTPKPASGTSTKSGRFDLSTFVLPANESVTSVKIWTYLLGSSSCSYKLGIYIGGVQQSVGSTTPITTNGAWYSHTWSSGALTQAQIDLLQAYIELTSEPASAAECTALYVEVTTTVTTTVTLDRGAGYSVFQAPVPIALQAKYVIGPKPSATTLTTLSDSYTKAAKDPWRPVLSPGAFFLGTERYHLYGKKAVKTLAEATVSVFKLAGPPIHGTASVTYAGLTYEDWFVSGDELHLKHRNPESWGSFYDANYSNAEQQAWINHGWLGKPSNTISITFQYLVWDRVTDTFTLQSATQSFTVKDDESRRYYRIEESSAEGSGRALASSHSTHKRYNWFAPRYGPVVLTDDSVENADARGEVPEFSLDPLTGEILLKGENLLRNPGFLVVDSGDIPYEWTAPSGTLRSRTRSFPYEACYGSRMLALAAGQTCYQTVRIRSPGPHTVSFYARVASPSGSTGKELTATYYVNGQAVTTAQTTQVKVVLNPIGVAGNYLNTDGSSAGTPYTDGVEVLSKTVTVTGHGWVRHTVVFGTADDFFSVDGGPIPEEAVKFEVRFKAPSTAADIDCVQVEEGYEAYPFQGLAGKTTIEYEASPDGNFVPIPEKPVLSKVLTASYAIAAGSNPTFPLSSQHPIKRDDLDLNPVQSEMPNGFLCLLEDGGSQDFKLGRGGDDIRTAGSGPKNVSGRYHLAYAKVSGLAKLQSRQSFHLDGSPVEEDVAPVRVALAAADMVPILPELSYIGSPLILLTAAYHITSGTNPTVPAVTVSRTSETHVETKAGKTTELVVLFLDQFENPLLGATCTITQKGAAGTTVSSVLTDRSGRARFSHKPQSGSSGKRAETVLFRVGEVSFTFTIDVI